MARIVEGAAKQWAECGAKDRENLKKRVKADVMKLVPGIDEGGAQHVLLDRGAGKIDCVKRRQRQRRRHRRKQEWQETAMELAKECDDGNDEVPDLALREDTSDDESDDDSIVIKVARKTKPVLTSCYSGNYNDSDSSPACDCPAVRFADDKQNRYVTGNGSSVFQVQL